MYKLYSEARKKTRDPVPEFGKDMRDQEFPLDPNVTFLNHGSWGVVPNRVKVEQASRLDEYDNHPDLFRRTLKVYWDESIQVAADFFGCEVGNLVFVENTTKGINDVVKSIPLTAGDAILQNDITYGAVKNTLRAAIVNKPGVEIVTLTHSYPFTNDGVIQEYRDILEANPNIKVAVIDHISSAPSIMFPVKQLTDICHEKNILVLIDGAHCPGQVRLNLADIGADFYIGNLHKWLYAARGCAILYAAPQHHGWLTPAITSWEYDRFFPDAWMKQGTRDDVPLANAKYSIEFFNWIGGWDAVEGYIQTLMADAMSLLTSAWGTGLLSIPKEMVAPYMRVIRLPDLNNYTNDREGRIALLNDLRNHYNIETSLVDYQGNNWLRLSINVYCTLEDVEKLKDAIFILDSQPTNESRVDVSLMDESDLYP